MGEVIPLGLGTSAAGSLWPATTVIEISPEVASGLGDDPAKTVREALAQLAAVPASRIGEVGVTVTPAGTVLVNLGADGAAARALAVSARRRATNVAEALHAALVDRG